MAAGHKRIHQEAHYQVDPSDYVEKGKAFPQRHDAYFTHGDHLIVLWKPTVEQRAIRAAEYNNGKFDVLNPAAFKAYQNKYEADGEMLAKTGTSLPAWNALENMYFSRFENPTAPKNGFESGARDSRFEHR